MKQIINKHNMFKSSNWQEADQLAMSTENNTSWYKQLNIERLTLSLFPVFRKARPDFFREWLITNQKTLQYFSCVYLYMLLTSWPFVKLKVFINQLVVSTGFLTRSCLQRQLSALFSLKRENGAINVVIIFICPLFINSALT